MELPALRENIENVSGLIFKLLHKYAAAGLSKGDNFDLVVAAFKVSFIWIFSNTLNCSKPR
jgi:U3 small nucleolar RNA-associated protein 20